MQAKANPDLALAAHLAKPYWLPGHSGQPLSLRSLPDGGMVVIAADGRKLWFTALEVGRARRELNQPPVKPTETPPNSPRLHEIDPKKMSITSKPPAKSRDGLSELIVLPESLKHLEEGRHAHPRKHPKPSTTNP